jgi:hypothetical protein
MNLAYLGDALDHWKGALFESLQDAHVLENLAVDAMASDQEQWAREDWSLFARLLRVQGHQVLRHLHTLRERPQYFAEISHRGDLFLDPDTGIRTSAGRNGQKYVNCEEIATLLDAAPNRVLAIYQHVRAQAVRTRVDGVIAATGQRHHAPAWVSYESGTVAMIFLSREVSRTHRVREHFRQWLGRHAENRVRAGVGGSAAG